MDWKEKARQLSWDLLRAQSEVTTLRISLEEFVTMYVDMINSGDCGNWDPETEPEVIRARAALALTKKDGPAEQEKTMEERLICQALEWAEREPTAHLWPANTAKDHLLVLAKQVAAERALLKKDNIEQAT